jgi:hypothetical protein
LKTLFVVNTKSDPISTAEHGFKVPILSPVLARTVSPVDSPREAIRKGGLWRAINARFKIMQAIHSKYLPATNNRGSRIKATCERGSVTIPYPHELSGDEVHRESVRQLVAKFCAEDLATYGTPIESNPWNRPFATGCLPGGTFAHVFIL